MKRLSIFLSLFVLIACTASQKIKHNEKYYAKKWCKEHRGRLEYLMPDRTRCDCLTKTHAVEVDWAEKWAEAIGQSLHYSRIKRRKAGIVIIYKGTKDDKYIKRLNDNIDYFSLPIEVYFIDKDKK